MKSAFQFIMAMMLLGASFTSLAVERIVDTYKYSDSTSINYGTELVLDATPEQIWNALVDIDNYNVWNAFTPRVETTFEVDSPIILHVRLSRLFPNALIRQPETVAVFEENSRMCWKSKIISEANFNTFRCLEIDTNDEGQTVLRNTMRYAGFSRAFFYLFSSQSVYDGFEDLSIGLRTYLENR